MNDSDLPTVEELLEAADRKVKELVRAIHCLPKPPEGMGDGPDERVANVIFLLQKAREDREKVREMCSAAIRKIEGGDDGWNFALARAEKIIRQLDLTALDEKEKP